MSDSTSQPIEVTIEKLEQWATDPKGPVALTMKQKLLPVTATKDEPGIIYPPTYADIGYCIDTLADNKKVALIDSVGSQANRMEPIFKKKFNENGPNDNGQSLVPQIEIVLHDQERRSLLDLPHRSADAVVQSCPTLKPMFDEAFEALRRNGDAGPLCRLAPTSLVFGVWDSRGGSGEKRPRLVRSIIRAWDVDVLHSGAPFNSVWKVLDEKQQVELQKEAKAKKVKLSEKGFADAPAVFKPKAKVLKFQDGAPNPEARVLAGILVRGDIAREVTINLLALRNIRGKDDAEAQSLYKYILGLALIAATEEIDLFLREGCHLRCAIIEDAWYAVPRRGPATPVNLGAATTRPTLLQFALKAAEPFREYWPKDLEHRFNLAEAKKLLAKKDENGPEEE